MAFEPRDDYLLEDDVLTVRYEYESVAKEGVTADFLAHMIEQGWEQYMEAKSRSTGVVYLRYRRRIK